MTHLSRLTLILLLAFALRMVNLDGRTLWYDEAFSVLFAEAGPGAVLQGTVAQSGGSSAEEHPPLYYLLLYLWASFTGDSPEAVRLFSVMAGLLSVAVVYRLASDLFDRQAAQAAALVAALAPFPIQYTQETRMYALMALWLLLAAWCFARGLKDLEEGKYWIGFGLFAALSMYTQQLSAFYLAALALFPLILRRWGALLRVALAGAGALALYLPWLLQLPGQLGKLSGGFWLRSPGVSQILQAFFVLTVPAIDLPSPVIVSGLLVAVILAVLIVWRGYARRHSTGWRLGLVVWLALIPAALMFTVSQIVPVFLLRALLPGALIFYIGVGWLTVRGGVPRLISGAVIALWLISGAAGLYTHYTWAKFPNAPFEQATTHLEQVVGTVVHSSKLSYLPMHYYAPDLPQTFVADPEGAPQDTLAPATQRALGIEESACVQAAAGASQSVWFVVFQRELDEYAKAGQPHPQLAWFTAHYTPRETRRFNDLLLMHFENPAPTTTTTCPEAAP